MSAIAPSHPGSRLGADAVRSARPAPEPAAARDPGCCSALAPPAYLLQTGGALTTGYEIQKLERERTVWLNRNQQLEVEIARARSLAWVEHEAVHRLGMQRPAQPIVGAGRHARCRPRPSRACSVAAASRCPPIPIEDGPSWLDALDYIATALGRGD